MWAYKGFETREQARRFVKQTGHNCIVERDGKRKSEYKDINRFGGDLDEKNTHSQSFGVHKKITRRGRRA